MSVRTPNPEPRPEAGADPVNVEWVPFQYREFYDFPRAIVVERPGGRFLLDCPFDDLLDGYPDLYQVVALDGAELLEGSWASLGAARAVLGTVPVAADLFDESRRSQLRWDLVVLHLGLGDEW